MKEKNKNLTAEQKLVLFEEGTEMAGTSELNHEKREGSFYCANCGEKLFESNTKYESGSGWPSFFESLPDVFETKTDTHIGYPRTEYHCKKCGVIMGTYLMMDHNLQVRDTVIMAFVSFLSQRINRTFYFLIHRFKS